MMTRGTWWLVRTGRTPWWVAGVVLVVAGTAVSVTNAQAPPTDVAARLESGRRSLVAKIELLKRDESIRRRLVADVEVFAKAVDWAIRHNEFYAPRSGKGASAWIGYAETALATGERRADELAAGKPSWVLQPGSTIRGYY
ncbi:MAG TPA: hypothetical protein DCE43_18175, partial [Planctomycetaceae bacterium]|nr:hypothetical protein [Planctomycetaceae bacterium]